MILRRERAAPLPDSCSPPQVARPSRPTLDLPPALGGGGTAGAEAREQALETLREGVRATSDTEYLITEEAAGALVEGGLTARSARIIPDMEGGQVVGMKLYGIRRNSALGVLGFRNGDTVRSLAGHDLSSPEQALEAYSSLRGRDEVTVIIERRGQPVELRYRVVARLPGR